MLYTLTVKGKHTADALKQQREQIIGQMIGHCRSLSELIGEDPEPIVALYERLMRGENPLAPVKGNLFRLRNMIFEMSRDGRLVRHQKQINTILSKAHKELETIK